MTLGPEWVLLVGYLDSLFAEGAERKSDPTPASAETLNQRYLHAMREHSRPAALEHLAGERRTPMPDWRLDRSVIRLALYFSERVGLEPGDRVAIVSDLRPEWVLADLAALMAGAVPAAIPVGLPPERLVAALIDLGPKTLVASSTELERLDGEALQLPGLEEVLVLDGPARRDGQTAFRTALDLGGTLDTPERAQALRAIARGVPPDHTAFIHLCPTDGSEPDAGWDPASGDLGAGYEPEIGGDDLARHELTQAEVLGRIQQVWDITQARAGDRVFIAGPVVTLDVRLALHACIGDGRSVAMIAEPGREMAELPQAAADRIVAPPALLAKLVVSAAGGGAADGPAAGERVAEEAESGASAERALPRPGAGWLAAFRSLLRPAPKRLDGTLKQVLGGRAREIRPTGRLDSAVATRLRAVAIVGPEIDSTHGGVA